MVLQMVNLFTDAAGTALLRLKNHARLLLAATMAMILFLLMEMPRIYLQSELLVLLAKATTRHPMLKHLLSAALARQTMVE